MFAAAALATSLPVSAISSWGDRRLSAHAPPPSAHPRKHN